MPGINDDLYRVTSHLQSKIKDGFKLSKIINTHQ